MGENKLTSIVIDIYHFVPLCKFYGWMHTYELPIRKKGTVSYAAENILESFFSMAVGW